MVPSREVDARVRPLGEKATERFHAEVPDESENWQIGLIVGPSGSGKSTIAGRAFGDKLYTGGEWPDDLAVVDCFGELSVRKVVDLFTAVGFGSPPSWVKPYGVLSNGERFRCDLARALACGYQHQEYGIQDAGCGEQGKTFHVLSPPPVSRILHPR